MIALPYSIESLKNGNQDAVEWANSLTQKEMDVLQQECICNEEDSLVHEYNSVIQSIRNGDYDFGGKAFYNLAKSAFFDEDEKAKRELAEEILCGQKISLRYKNTEKFAYRLWIDSCDGRVLAYALLTGITTNDARKLSEYDQLSSPWEYENGDRATVYRDLIETLLYEDNQQTQWKKAPRDIILQLLKDGLSHPGISDFLNKYKDTDWGKKCGYKVHKISKSEKVVNSFWKFIGHIIIGIICISFCLFLIWFAGAVVTGLGSIFGWANGIKESTGEEMFVNGLYVSVVFVILAVICKVIDKIANRRK